MAKVESALMIMNMGCNALLEKLAPCQRVLLVGAGGGYDIYCGLPLYQHLQSQGKQAFLASLAFTPPDPSWGIPLRKGLVELRAPAERPLKIGAETCLAMWFASNGQDIPVYCFGADGAQQLLEHYRFLVKHLQLDALVLVDGGTDSLLRGDEPGLGSPGEDVASLAAAHQLDLPVRLLACLGFGLDAHHHVCHAYVLEAAADLTASGDFLGAFSLLPNMPEFQFLLQAVDFSAQQKEARLSIIASSVVAAGQGKFGNHHASERTKGSSLMINPLMSMYWGFQVDGLAKRCLYLDKIKSSQSRGEITLAIQQFRSSIKQRAWMNLPF
jgi:hypothetical protein